MVGRLVGNVQEICFVSGEEGISTVVKSQNQAKSARRVQSTGCTGGDGAKLHPPNDHVIWVSIHE